MSFLFIFYFKYIDPASGYESVSGFRRSPPNTDPIFIRIRNTDLDQLVCIDRYTFLLPSFPIRPGPLTWPPDLAPWLRTEKFSDITKGRNRPTGTFSPGLPSHHFPHMRKSYKKKCPAAAAFHWQFICHTQRTRKIYYHSRIWFNLSGEGWDFSTDCNHMYTRR